MPFILFFVLVGGAGLIWGLPGALITSLPILVHETAWARLEWHRRHYAEVEPGVWLHTKSTPTHAISAVLSAYRAATHTLSTTRTLWIRVVERDACAAKVTEGPRMFGVFGPAPLVIEVYARRGDLYGANMLASALARRALGLRGGEAHRMAANLQAAVVPWEWRDKMDAGRISPAHLRAAQDRLRRVGEPVISKARWSEGMTLGPCVARFSAMRESWAVLTTLAILGAAGVVGGFLVLVLVLAGVIL